MCTHTSHFMCSYQYVSFTTDRGGRRRIVVNYRELYVSLDRSLYVFFCYTVLSKSLPNAPNDLVLVLQCRRLHSASRLFIPLLTQWQVGASQRHFSPHSAPCSTQPVGWFSCSTSLHISGLSCEHQACIETVRVLIAVLCGSDFNLTDVLQQRRLSRAS